MPTFQRKAESGASPLDVLMIILAFAGGIILASYYKNENTKKIIVEYKQELALAKVGKCDNLTQDNKILKTSEEQNADRSINQIAPENGTSEDAGPEPSDLDNSGDDQDSKKTQNFEGGFDIEKASTPRILGNPNAPVKISEHSSFTCGGCGLFHANNFKQIKRDFIDTGKAYLVFDDFPRNQFDIIVGAAARCVPEAAYFNFIQLIFESQKKWAGQTGYIDFIKQNAKLTGASDTDIDACLNSEELKEALAQRQNRAYTTYGVKSTPTLIINDSTTMSGLAEYNEIKTALDNAYKQSQK